MAGIRCQLCKALMSASRPCKRCENLNLSGLEPLGSRPRPKYTKKTDQINYRLFEFEPPPSEEKP